MVRQHRVGAALVAVGLALLLQPALPALPAQATFTANPAYKVNAGGGFAVPWNADSNVSGGTTFSTANPITTTDQYDPAPAAVYQSERRGVFTYTLDGLASGGRFTLRLHFAEIVHNAANLRKFNVAVNGSPVLSDFDILGYTGAANRAVVRSFNVTANGAGEVVVSFTNGSVGTPKVSGLELIPGFSYKVGAGNAGPVGEFAADSFFTGGSTITFAGSVDRTAFVGGPPPLPVYQSIRYGASGSPVSYSFPNLTAGARYQVRLHFAEVSPFTTTVGARVFDVAINGVPMLDDFDMLEAAGAHSTAVVRQFFITASGTGTISVGLTAVVGDVVINGIEIAPMRSYAIDSGGFGATGWAPNTYIDQGSDAVFGGTIDTSGVTNPAPQAVYQSYHYGVSGTPRFTHAVNGLMPGAVYRVRLHFAETVKTAANQRRFHVAVNNSKPSGQPPELALENYDVFDRAGGANRAVVAELATHADTGGNIRVQFYAVLDQPIINAIEVFPEPDLAAGWSITDFGRLGTPSGVRGRDGKASALLGNGAGARMLWTYGDTFLNGPTGPSSTPPAVDDWTNTGSISTVRRPQVSTELTDSTTPPAPATDKPRSQLIPFTTAEYNYTLDCWYDPPCANSPAGPSRYIIWPSAAIRLPGSGDVVVMGETNMNIFDNPCLSNCPPTGVYAATVSAGTTPGSATRHPGFVFSWCERRYSDGGTDDGTYAYLYRAHFDEHFDDCSAGSGNYQWNTVGSTWSSCGPPPRSACTTTYDPPAHILSVTSATGTSTTDVASWQFIGNQVEFFAAKRPDAGQVELSVVNASNTVVWGPQTFDLYDPAFKGNQLIATATLASSGTYKLRVRPTGVAGAGGGRVVTIDSARSRDTTSSVPRTYVARVPLNIASITNGAAYTVWNRTCSCWDSNKANATPMAGPTAGSNGPARGLEDIGYSPYLDRYLATSTVFPSNELWLYTAPDPWGPWDAGVPLGRGSNGTAIYASSVHPELSVSGGQTFYVTYSRFNANFWAEVRILEVTLPVQ